MEHHKRHKHDIIVILAVLGLSVSLYLALTKALGIAVPCGITKGCEYVLSSKYSSFMGIELSAMGVMFYGAVIVSALLANHYKLWRKLLTWLLGAGAIAALTFLAIQFFVLHQICQYCLVTDSLSILLFLWDLNIEHKQPGAIV